MLEQVDGFPAVLQNHPAMITQASHPSVFKPFESSHSSAPSVIPFPHVDAQDESAPTPPVQAYPASTVKQSLEQPSDPPVFPSSQASVGLLIPFPQVLRHELF